MLTVRTEPDICHLMGTFSQVGKTMPRSKEKTWSFERMCREMYPTLPGQEKTSKLRALAFS